MATTKSKTTRIRREELAPGACLCDHCTGKCCRYFSVPLDAPKGWDDYDAVRWYLAHGQTLVYVEKGDWFLVVMSRCKYLTRDDRCQIYLSRPKICNDYTTAECEYDDDWLFEKVFETPEQLWEYAEAVLPPRRARTKASATPQLISFNGEPMPVSPPVAKSKGR